MAGAPARAQRLLDTVTEELDDLSQRVTALRVQGAVHQLLNQPARTASNLLGAARQLWQADAAQARAALVDALAAAQLSGRFAASGAREADVIRTARSMPLPAGSPRTTGDLLLDADTALLRDDHQAAAPMLRQAVTVLLDAPLDSTELLTWAGMGCQAAGALGDDHALHALASRAEVQARDRAHCSPCPQPCATPGYRSCSRAPLARPGPASPSAAPSRRPGAALVMRAWSWSWPGAGRPAGSRI